MVLVSLLSVVLDESCALTPAAVAAAKHISHIALGSILPTASLPSSEVLREEEEAEERRATENDLPHY